LNIFPTLDHLGSIASLLSLPGALIAIGAWLREKKTVTRTLVLWGGVLVAAVAYAIDIIDRFGVVKFSEAPLCACDVIQSWGGEKQSMVMTVNSKPLVNYKDHFKIIVVIRYIRISTR
jgi:hypothetical protein